MEKILNTCTPMEYIEDGNYITTKMWGREYKS